MAPKMFDRRSSNTFNFFVGLNPERRQVIEALNAVDIVDEKIAEILGVGPDDVDHALSCNAMVMTNPLMSALDRFKPGSMYKALDFENLPTGAQRRLLEHGIIISSLFGLLRPDDLIPEHYLSLNAELHDIGTPLSYWTPFIQSTLDDLLEGHFVWNLLAPAYAGAWEPDGRHGGLVEIDFYRTVDGDLIDDENELEELRGSFVNTLVRGPSDSLDSLSEFDESFDLDIVGIEWDDETRSGRVKVVPLS